MEFETRWEPGLEAAGCSIRAYSSLDADPGTQTIECAAPVRAEPFLQIVLEGDHRLRNLETGRIVRSGPATLIGLCTYRKYNLLIGSRLRMFFVHFQPGALHAWGGLDMSSLTDNCLDAEAVFGEAVCELRNALAAAASAEEQVRIADQWFAARPLPELDGIAAVARSLRDGRRDTISLGLPDGLSARQFQRRFARQIGTTPKLYARLCRLAAVVQRHEADPSLSWTDLAHEGGYADQAHLTREFRAFVRAAPSRFRDVGPGLAA
jgi:hypothetical protein